MRHFLAAAIIVGASQAGAGVCGPDRPDDIALFESAKDAFLQADYKGFAGQLGPYFPTIIEQFNDIFGQIQVVFPNPFTRCWTVLQRHEAPGFYQEVVFYFPAGSDAPVALLLVAAEVEGEIKLVEFNFNTSISEVLSDIK